jgi:hypothetical protein
LPIKLVLLLALSVVATGACSDQRLSPESHAKLGRIDAIVEVNQAAITRGRPNSGYLPPSPPPKSVAAAIGTAIDAGVTTVQRKSVAEAIDLALWNFDFASRLATVTRDRLESRSGLDVHVRPAVSRMPIDTRSFFDESTASAVLIFTVAYYLDSDNEVVFYGEAALFPKTEALRRLRRFPNDKEPLAFGNTVFRESFQLHVPVRTIADVQATFAQAANDLADRLALRLAP